MKETLITISIIISNIVFVVVFIVIAVNIAKKKKMNAQQKLLQSALEYMNLSATQLQAYFGEYQKFVEVKSKATLEKYNYSSFFKDNRNYFDIIENFLLNKSQIINILNRFLKNNPFVDDKEYKFLENYLKKFATSGAKYVIRVGYISRAGNNLGVKDLPLTIYKLKEIENTPELYMTKTEMKAIDKGRLEEKKKLTYSKVNLIIERANNIKDKLITKKEVKTLDSLIATLFDRTVNSIQSIKQLDSGEWTMIDNVISSTESSINNIIKKNERLSNYYMSEDFANIKKTCELLMDSQKEFNSYIEEKIETISKSFGTRATRNETEIADVYNYVRPYNKTISPFTVELSSGVFSSAENNPIQYLIKYFYPNKSQYEDQIIDLKNLLNELDALKDAKIIIENYKKEYAKYVENVPQYVFEDDEDGFYSRLGFAVIDENVLNVEYKFVYTSGGGMAQRSFTIPMTEETIAELINQLQNKLSLESLAKEQRALMTEKLRLFIKERDNYTCCLCGNSTFKEPNLLLEIDHIIPIAKGGLTIEGNLQTLCWKCNRNKGAKII